MLIRNAVAADAAQICAIYNPYVTNTWVTFEEQPVEEEDMVRRIADISASFDWLVMERNGELVGYAYSNQWRSRSAYRYSVEGTIYLANHVLRGGYGTALYGELILRQRRRGMHCIMGGVALPNEASVRLHEKLCFKKVAHFSEIGWKLGHWRDVGYWQLKL